MYNVWCGVFLWKGGCISKPIYKISGSPVIILKCLKRNSMNILTYIFKVCFKVFGTVMSPCQNVVDNLNRSHAFFACQTCKYLMHLK